MNTSTKSNVHRHTNTEDYLSSSRSKLSMSKQNAALNQYIITTEVLLSQVVTAYVYKTPLID